jgi:hypothetical protein
MDRVLCRLIRTTIRQGFRGLRESPSRPKMVFLS